jgi:hypothetical protein
MKDFSDEAIEHSRALQIGRGRLGIHLEPHLKKFFGADHVHVIQNEKDFHSCSENLDFTDYEFIFLAVPDRALNDLIQRLHSKAKLVHFSGFIFNENALGVHPLASFSKAGEVNLCDLQYVVDGVTDSKLERLFPKRLPINPKYKAKYHTYLSTAANGIQLMVHLLARDFQKDIELPSSILKKIVLQSLEREAQFGEQSFSGPWTRGEGSSQQKEISNIKNENLSDLNMVFQKMIERYQNERSRI